jgi:hypothetical protein
MRVSGRRRLIEVFHIREIDEDSSKGDLLP